MFGEVRALAYARRMLAGLSQRSDPFEEMLLRAYNDGDRELNIRLEDVDVVGDLELHRTVFMLLRLVG